MTKYKEMYEWEKAAHGATEQELQRFKAMYAELQSRLNAVSSFAQNENTRYRDALEKIEMMSNGFVKSLAQEVLNDGMDEE